VCDGQSAALREWVLTSSPLRGPAASRLCAVGQGECCGLCGVGRWGMLCRAAEALWGATVRESGNVRDGG
jgi:hypothetical protein